MRIVIEISEEDKKVIDRLLKGSGLIFHDNAQLIKRVVLAVFHGYPLPEGHGRLIDADRLREEVHSWGMNDYEPLDFVEEIDDTPTVVAADKLVDLYEEFKGEFEEE